MLTWLKALSNILNYFVGIHESFRDLPPVHLLFPVRIWIRCIRLQSGQKALFEAVYNGMYFGHTYKIEVLGVKIRRLCVNRPFILKFPCTQCLIICFNVTVRMDSCHTSDRCHSITSHHAEYIWRPNLVRSFPKAILKLPFPCFDCILNWPHG